MTKYEMKKAFSRLLINRCTRDMIETSNGQTLSDTDFGVLAMIGNGNGVTIQNILSHPYFANDIALSTVKRSVVTLMQEGLIKATTSDSDRRERLLTINEVE